MSTSTGARVSTSARVGRDAALWRLDLAARGTLLAAGLLAQAAMWVVAPAWVYPVAAVVLVALSAVAARRPFIAPAAARYDARSGRRRRNAYRIVACVAFAEICVGVVGSMPFAGAAPFTGPVPMAVPIGVLLLTVQAAQVQAIESRRDAMVGLVIVAVMLTDAGFFARNARPAVPVLASMSLLLVAVALLQRGSVLARTRTAVGLPAAPALRALLAPVTTAVVIGAIVFLAMPNSLQLGTRSSVGHLALGGAASDAAMAGRAAIDPGASTLDLRVRGALSDQPVLAVAADSPDYWQSSIFDTFDGTRWTTTGAAQLNTPAQPVRTDVVHVLSPLALNEVIAPGAPTAYSGPGEMVPGADGTALLTSVTAVSPWTYEVSSTTPATDPRILRAATGADPTDPLWTAVEAGLPSRVRDLAAQLTASAPTRYDAVNAVDDYLQTHGVYDLTSPVPAPGHDAVDDFLFVSHRGFCEQFASAAVIMLRSSGIPARLVTGYSHGDLTSEPGERVMRGTDAHAWVQVWYPGVGWVTSDPTAASVLPAAPVPVATAATHRRPTERGATLRFIPGGRVGGLIALVAVIAIAFCTAQLIAFFRRRRPAALRPSPTQAPRPGDGPVLQAYVRLDAALGRDAPDGQTLGGAEREPAQIFREVARHLDAAGCSREELAAAMQCLERECYAIVPPAPSEVAIAVDVFDRLHAVVDAAVVP